MFCRLDEDPLNPHSKIKIWSLFTIVLYLWPNYIHPSWPPRPHSPGHGSNVWNTIKYEYLLFYIKNYLIKFIKFNTCIYLQFMNVMVKYLAAFFSKYVWINILNTAYWNFHVHLVIINDTGSNHCVFVIFVYLNRAK